MKINKSSMLSTAGAAAIAAVVAMPAFAADAIYEQPPAPPAAPMEVAPVSTWAGPYAGVALGYGFEGNIEVDGTDADEKADGFVGNVFGGWNGQSGSFVYGVEADVGYNGMKAEDGGDEVKHGVDGSLRARLGYAATENVLVYGTAGGAASRIQAEALGDSDSATALGWTAGVGTDVKLTPKSFARLEYRYTDLGEETLNLGGTDYEVGSTSHKVMVGFGMQF